MASGAGPGLVGRRSGRRAVRPGILPPGWFSGGRMVGGGRGELGERRSGSPADGDGVTSEGDGHGPAVRSPRDPIVAGGLDLGAMGSMLGVKSGVRPTSGVSDLTCESPARATSWGLRSRWLLQSETWILDCFFFFFF